MHEQPFWSTFKQSVLWCQLQVCQAAKIFSILLLLPLLLLPSPAAAALLLMQALVLLLAGLATVGRLEMIK